MATHADTVLRVCSVYLPHRADYEKAFHDTFLSYAYFDGSFSDEEHKKAWFTRVVRYLIEDLTEGFQTKADSHGGTNAKHLGEPQDDRQEDPQTLGAKNLLQALHTLDTRTRTVLCLRYYEGCSLAVVSLEAGISEPDMHAALARGRHLLGKSLGIERYDFGRVGSVEAAEEREFEKIFAPLSTVRASDDLKERTLAAVFADLDAADMESSREGTDGAFGASPRKVHPQSASTGENATDREAHGSAEASHDDGQALSVRSARERLSDAETTRTTKIQQREQSLWRFRYVAILLIAVLAMGGVAHLVPFTRVTVTEGGMSVKLDINVFGRTVEASSDSDEGERLLASHDVGGMQYEDAMACVVKEISALGMDDGSVRIRVTGGTPGQRDDIDDAADRVIASQHKRRGYGRRNTQPDKVAFKGHEAM